MKYLRKHIDLKLLDMYADFQMHAAHSCRYSYKFCTYQVISGDKWLSCALKVVDWLQEVYGGEQIPPYEKTERSITILHQLMTASKCSEDNAKILADDYVTKTAEYSAEGEQWVLIYVYCSAFLFFFFQHWGALREYKWIFMSSLK